ncbi:hypothetical protein BH09BAC6_BH09BAC6_07550 [soil metagenome]|jgi:hypothetical protein
MKFKTLTILAVVFACSCQVKYTRDDANALHLNGTWRLVSGTTITKGVSVFTDYTKDQRMIKIINHTHFAFLKHSLNTAKDSVNHFDGGGGSYTLSGNQYTEHLDYYADKNWEGKTFKFTVSIKNDTLIQQGLEKVEKEGIDRTIIEKYLRVK